MKRPNLSLPHLTSWLMAFCFFSFSILSYILLFRDKRALEGLSIFYPQISHFLFSTRNWLLEHNLNTIPTFLFGAVACTTIYCYLKSLTIKISLKATIIFAIIFQIITFLSYPILSTDIFSYMLLERVTTIHNQNIWKVAPMSFPQDQFYKMADWKETTSIYGGTHFITYLLPSILSGDNLILSTILFKIIPFLFSIGIGYISYLLLKIYKPQYLEKGLRLIFWNPLFILEIAGSGHNDSIMIFFTLLCIYLYTKKRWLLAGIALAFAFQVKILPVILLFFFLLKLIKEKMINQSVIFLSSFLGVNALIFILMQVNPINFLQRILYNGGVYWQSLPNMLRYFLNDANIYILGIFLLWLCLFIAQQWKKKQIDPIYCYTIVLLIYLLFVSAAYWNWYVLWTLPLLPFIKNNKLFRAVLIFSFTSLLAYPLLWTSLRFGFGSMLWPFITYIFIFIPPIAAYLFPLRGKGYNISNAVY